jgi:hypothetical protein
LNQYALVFSLFLLAVIIEWIGHAFIKRYDDIRISHTFSFLVWGGLMVTFIILWSGKVAGG